MIEKALLILEDTYDEKARLRGLEAITEVRSVLQEAEHQSQEHIEAVSAIASYDSTWTGISLNEGISRLKQRSAEQAVELSELRDLTNRQDNVITSAKVALVESVTADHRWHPASENCPHVRCMALNRIEELRG